MSLLKCVDLASLSVSKPVYSAIQQFRWHPASGMKVLWPPSTESPGNQEQHNNITESGLLKPSKTIFTTQPCPDHPLGCLYLGGWSAWRVAWRAVLARQDLEKRKRYGSGSLLHYDNIGDFPSKKHIPWRGTRKGKEHPSYEKWCPVNFPWMCTVIPAWFYMVCHEMPLIGNLMHPSRALHIILQ